MLDLMRPVEHFKYCPRCGSGLPRDAANPLRCGTCHFLFYFNSTVAAAVILTRADGRVLCITRAKEPALGKLAFPGGFIDIGETAEAGLRREVREEVGLEIGPLEFLCSHPNEYLYQEVSYPVLDLLFTANTDDDGRTVALDGVAAFQWLDADAVRIEDLAFPSLRAGMLAFQRRRL